MTSLMGRIDWGRTLAAVLVTVVAVVFYGTILYCILWSLREICEVLL